MLAKLNGNGNQTYNRLLPVIKFCSLTCFRIHEATTELHKCVHCERLLRVYGTLSFRISCFLKTYQSD